MFKIIQHNSLDNSTLNEIIAVKQKSWNYTAEEHLLWMQKNITAEDYHFLLIEGGNIVAYVNLVNVVVGNSNSLMNFYGIGNVCSKLKGHGYGKLLMIELNKYLIDNSIKGILFCQQHLVQFYQKYDWLIIDNLHPNSSVSTMVFNCNLLNIHFESVNKIF